MDGDKDTNSWSHAWLVGVTDGDGSFTISKSNGKWTAYFKIAQSTYNLRLLYHIKSIVGAGTVYVDPKNNIADYRLRNAQLIVSKLLPIFDTHLLLTSKYFNYLRFKTCVLIMVDTSLSSVQKDLLLTDLTLPVNTVIPVGYISPAWSVVNYSVQSLSDAMTVVSKPWLVGFTEAEGSFYLYNKDKMRIVHAFSITQKLDRIVLEAIGFILQIPVLDKKTYRAVSGTSDYCIPHIIRYYANTMKGMKSLEYRIWARSYMSKPTDGSQFSYLQKVLEQMRNIRSIRLDKNFKIAYYAVRRR